MKKQKKNVAEKVLRTAANGLSLWETDNLGVDDFLDTHCKSGSAERKMVSSVLFVYFRHKSIVDALINAYAKSPKPRVRRVLEVCITQAFYQDGITAESAANVAVNYCHRRFGRIPGNYVNAVLRNVLAVKLDGFIDSLSVEEKSGAPPELFKRWSTRFGENKVSELLKLYEEETDLTFRCINLKKFKELECAGFICERVELPEILSDVEFYTTPEPAELFKNNNLQKYGIYIQDPATALVASLVELKDNALLLDLCAAPGGKSLSFLDKMRGGRIVAADQSFKRQLLTKQNFERLNICNDVQCLVIASTAQSAPFNPKTFDLVLCDVPCSNTGVFRRRPDVLWRFSEKSLMELTKKQQQILASAAELVKSGGQLVYSTCSIENEENREQVDRFLSENKDFKLIVDQLLLPDKTHDGAYVAVIGKNR